MKKIILLIIFLLLFSCKHSPSVWDNQLVSSGPAAPLIEGIDPYGDDGGGDGGPGE